MRSGALAGLVLVMVACGASEDGSRGATGELDALVRCLEERGLVYYGSATCSACRGQKQAFGEAFAGIVEVECHPRTEGNQVDRCLARGIRVTPTWLIERDGREVSRLEGVRDPSELAAFAGCAYDAPG